MSELPLTAAPHAARPAATSAAAGDASLAPLPLAGGESEGVAAAMAPSPLGEGVGGGGVEPDGNGRARSQPRPAATRQRAAQSRCPSPEGAGDGGLPAPRHNQWTRARMVAFLRELAATQSVAAAAQAVGMSRTAAYNLRHRLEDEPFGLAWDLALECGMQPLAQAVLDRALHGETVDHYYHGELIGTTRRYDNRLAQWLLQNPGMVARKPLSAEYIRGFERLLEQVAAG